jgi:hypothetical protein
VAKVKSEAKRASLQGHSPPPLLLLPSPHPIGSASSNKHRIYRSVGSAASDRSQTTTVSLKETEENVNVRKELWKKFLEKIHNVEIIIETGLNPGSVWSEFQYFLTFRNCDPYAIQKDAVAYLVSRVGKIPYQKDIADPYEKLVEKFKANGHLTNTEFSTLLSLLSQVGYESGIDAVAFKMVRPPKGWARPQCSLCGEPMSGLVANPFTKIGKSALDSVERYQHSDCLKKKEPQKANH